MILVDTSGLLSALFRDQRHHSACRRAIEESEGPLVLSPFVLAELDYLVGRYGGSEAQSRLLKEVAAGSYELAPFSRSDVGRAKSVLDRYADLAIGLADASMVVLSERHSLVEILTLDQRHFRVLTAFAGQPFRILPFDSSSGKVHR